MRKMSIKILLVLSLFISSLSFSNTTDEEYGSLLKKGEAALKQNNLELVKKYLKEYVYDTRTSTRDFSKLYGFIYSIEQDVTEKIKLSETGYAKDDADENYVGNLVVDYTLILELDKANEIKEKYFTKITDVEKDLFNYKLVRKYLEIGADTEALELANSILAKDNIFSKITGNRALVDYYTHLQEYDKAIEHAQNIVKLHGQSNKENQEILFNLYLAKGDDTKSLEYLAKLGDGKQYLLAVVLAGSIEDKTLTRKYLTEYMDKIGLEERELIKDYLKRSK